MVIPILLVTSGQTSKLPSFALTTRNCWRHILLKLLGVNWNKSLSKSMSMFRSVSDIKYSNTIPISRYKLSEDQPLPS